MLFVRFGTKHSVCNQVIIVLLFLSFWLVGCSGSQITRNASQPKASKINLSLGIRYMQKGHMQRALRKLQIAHKQNPQDVNVQMMLAYWYQRQQQDNMAQKWYEQALNQAPHNWRLINNYADFLCEQGHYEAAIRRFIHVAKHRQNKKQVGQAYENAGLCSLKAQQKQQANQFFHKAVQVDSSLRVSQQKLAETVAMVS